MFISRRKVVLTALAAATALFVLATQIGAFGPGQGAVKLEGAWIARVVGLPYPDPVQWSYVLVPDASGRSASLHGSVDMTLPGGPPIDFTTPIIGEIVQTGHDTAAFNTYWYGIKDNLIVYIGRSWGETRFTGPRTLESTHHFEIYLPDADTNGDGLPELSFVNAFVLTTHDTRVPAPVRPDRHEDD